MTYTLAISTGSKKSKSWVAQITGEDEKWGLKREFINQDSSVYELENGVYNYRNGETGKVAFIVVKNGEATEIAKEEALKALEQLNQPEEVAEEMETEMEEVVEEIKTVAKEENRTFAYVGFRQLMEDEDYKVGDYARNSYEWDLENDDSTYFTTKEETDGTCVTGGMIELAYDTDEEIIEKLKAWQAANDDENYDGVRQAILIGFSEGGYGTRDENELRIVGAKVLAFVK